LEVITKNKWLTKNEIDEINAWVKKEVDESVEFAENSPFPEAHEIYEDVYTQKDYPYIKEYLA
jgi:pyruvate dehydrogenase E1 component alpha subunit